MAETKTAGGGGTAYDATARIREAAKLTLAEIEELRSEKIAEEEAAKPQRRIDAAEASLAKAKEHVKQAEEAVRVAKAEKAEADKAAADAAEAAEADEEAEK